MKVLVACEESQTVMKAFRALGHEAYSCDILDCSGGFPEYHIKDDVTKIINQDWDLIIAHPPCTYISHAGARWLYPKGVLNQERFEKGKQAAEFFNLFLNLACEKVCVENPVPSSIYGLPKHSQMIQPYFFGEPFQKKTLLWLKGLPQLVPTKIVDKGEFVTYKSGKTKSKWFMDAAKAKTPAERARLRSKTFEGIAMAMAQQWGAM
jgi:hypothetical protein